MDKNELERLEAKLKVDNLSHEEIKSLLSEVKKLKTELNKYKDFVEDEQSAREYVTSIFMVVLDKNNIIEVPTPVVKNMQYIKSNNQSSTLKEGIDFTIKRTFDADTYMIDFSSYLLKNLFNEADVDTISIYYFSWR